MSPALPGVVRRGAVRRRLAVRRGVSAALALIMGWVVLSAGLGALSRARDLCTSCHTMRPYAELASASTHSSLGCIACHKTEGRLGILPDGIALQRRMLGSMLGAKPQVSSVDDAPCLRCHTGIRAGVTVARGIRVSHADFIDKPCGECHAGVAHAVEGRRYVVPEMDSCMACHSASPNEVSGCSLCHSAGAQRQRRETDTSWRVTHGPTWEASHGLGEMKTCRTCHAAQDCVRCHGTPIPHTAEWPQIHGKGLAAATRKACATCHEPTWCDACHGIEMPHPPTFLPAHGPIADEVGEDKCNSCHAAAGCTDCHLRSAHPDLPGVGMGHGDGK